MKTPKYSSYLSLFVYSVVLLFKYAASVGGPPGYYSNNWILKSSGGKNNVHNFVVSNGFEVVSEIQNGIYVLRKADLPPVSEVADNRNIRSMDTKVMNLEQLRYLNRTTRSSIPRTLNITDGFWSTMWHVHEDKFPSMSVYDAWLLGYTGAGIHVSVLDNGVEPDHTDLLDNYDETNSFDYLTDRNYVNQTDGEYHGTWCAGIVSAVKNSECAIGMAYNSRFSAVKIFDNFLGLNDLGESLALTHALEETDIYSNSWGPYDSGEIFEGPELLAKAALQTGVTEGRGGLGAIYTWAAGNGGVSDDCNCDGFTGSIYTISVTSIGYDQAPSWYSEECTNIMAGTYSGDSPDPSITTTHIGGGCITYFQGTSASCPMGAGIVALTLEANPTLTWRDVQHLIVETSIKEGLIGADWTINGAGFAVSHAYGFGMMNAVGMVNAALDWTNVPQQVTCEREMSAINSESDNGITISSEHVSNGCGDVQYVEHVEVWMSFSSTYRGALVIKLTSPSGTRSRLLRRRQYDRFNGTTEWTFMTVHSWGERSDGTWTLDVETTDSTIVFGLDSWKLILYGTQSAPANYPAAQTSVEEESDNSTTYGIVGGVLGGLVVGAVVAILVYKFVLTKPKDPTVYPARPEAQVAPSNTQMADNTPPQAPSGADNAGFQQET